MKLPVPTLFNKKEKTEYFLSLLLRDEKASAVILEELEGKIHIIGKHEEYFSTSVERVSIAEMLEVLDRTISKAEEALPPNIETEKTVFGVKENWVEDKKIKKEYLVKLKEVSDELHLKPIGFLVISEAIAHLIQEEEGAPFTGIIAEVGRKAATLTLFRASKAIETHAAEIEETVPATVDKLLKHFTSSDILPSRVILFNGQKSEALAQEFIAHQWSRSLPFLHVPQVAVLPGNFDARAVVFGAAEQMGFEIVGSIVDRTAHEIRALPTHEKDRKHMQGDHEKHEADDKDGKGDKETEPPDKENADIPTNGDNFGFVMEEDVAASLTKDKEETQDAKADNFARVDEDTAKEADAFKHADRFQTDKPAHRQFDATEGAVDSADENDGAKTSPLALLMGVATGIMAKIPDMSILKERLGSIGRGNKLLFLPPFILLLIVGFILFYFFQAKATVSLSLQPKMVDETETVVFATSGGNSFEDRVIKAQQVTTTLSGNTTGTATGKKEVGDKAKGSVTIFNSDDQRRTLAAGTTITSSNDLQFVLDKEVEVASASGDIFSGIKSGTTKVDVTAAKFGTEYNLPSNTKFTVEGSSTLAARNDSAFSGGTKKTVTVVSKNDLAKLDDALPKSLEGKAREELQKKLSADSILLPNFTAVSLTKKSYSKKEGEEAKDIRLAADVSFDGIAYKKSDLEQFAMELLKGKATSDQAIAGDTIEADATEIEESEDGTFEAQLAIKAGLLPKLDTKEIVEKIVGKSVDEASAVLSDLPQAREAEITFSPNIPFLPKLLPRRTENITIIIND